MLKSYKQICRCIRCIWCYGGWFQICSKIRPLHSIETPYNGPVASDVRRPLLRAPKAEVMQTGFDKTFGMRSCMCLQYHAISINIHQFWILLQHYSIYFRQKGLKHCSLLHAGETRFFLHDSNSEETRSSKVSVVACLLKGQLVGWHAKQNPAS